MNTTSRFVSTSALLVLGASCGSSGGGGNGGGGGPVLPPPVVALFATDAPSDDLLSLTGAIDAVVLFRQGGGDTGDLLDAAVPVDLVSLGGTNLPLAAAVIPEGTYTAAFVAFAPTGLTARTESGFTLPVTMPIGSGTDSFDSPLEVAEGETLALQLDFDLVRSVAPDAGGLVFIPSFAARTLPAGAAIASFDAIVTEEVPAARTFRADLVLQDASAPPFGSIEVEVEASDLLVDANAQALGSTAAFFAELAVGSRVAVRGGWQGAGFVDASVVRIETGSAHVVEIAGRIVAHSIAGTSFALQVASVESGAAIANPILLALGNPPAILVDYAPGTPSAFLDPPAPIASPASTLQIGHEVHVRFNSFGGIPFIAAAIDVARPAVDVEGTITDTSGIPSSFELTFDLDDPQTLSGLAPASLPVDLAGLAGDPTLALPGAPAVPVGASAATSALQPGMRVRVRGAVPIPVTTVVAESVVVLPGRVRTSQVTGVNTAAGSFSCTFNTAVEPDDPFGGTTTSPGSVSIQLGAALFGPTGATITITDMSAAFLNPPPGTSLRAEFQGVGTATPGTLKGYDVRLRFQ